MQTELSQCGVSRVRSHIPQLPPTSLPSTRGCSAPRLPSLYCLHRNPSLQSRGERGSISRDKVQEFLINTE